MKLDKYLVEAKSGKNKKYIDAINKINKKHGTSLKISSEKVNITINIEKDNDDKNVYPLNILKEISKSFGVHPSAVNYYKSGNYISIDYYTDY